MAIVQIEAEALKGYKGKEVAVSDWLTVTATSPPSGTLDDPPGQHASPLNPDPSFLKRRHDIDDAKLRSEFHFVLQAASNHHSAHAGFE